MKKNYIQPKAESVSYKNPLLIDMSNSTPADPGYAGGGDAKESSFFDEDED